MRREHDRGRFNDGQDVEPAAGDGLLNYGVAELTQLATQPLPRFSFAASGRININERSCKAERIEARFHGFVTVRLAAFTRRSRPSCARSRQAVPGGSLA